MIALLFACSSPPEDTEVSVGAPAQELVMPSLDDVDLPQAFADALRMATEVTLSAPWQGNVDALELAHTGCPDLYVGAPEDADLAEQLGVSWYDYCTTPGGLYYGGYVLWDGAISGDGDADSETGRTIEGSRQMIANGVVGDDDAVLFEFKGSGSDSLYQVEAKDYTRWTYSSLLEATVTGESVAAGTDGWRTDLYLYATGGDADSVELRGNLYLFGPHIAERFDSVAMELSITGPTGAAPDACTAEPTGWIGLRDENAYWYDLVFLPTSGEADSDTYSACDGCGTLYVRGIETASYGEVCMDFSWLWEEGAISLPASEDFIFTIRQM